MRAKKEGFQKPHLTNTVRVVSEGNIAGGLCTQEAKNMSETAKYFHELNHGNVHGVQVFEDEQLVANIWFAGSHEGIGVRSRDYFAGYNQLWDWNQGRDYPPTDPAHYEFGTRYQYEGVFYSRNPLVCLPDEELRKLCIKLFEVDPGPVPDPLTPEEIEKEREARGLKKASDDEDKKCKPSSLLW